MKGKETLVYLVGGRALHVVGQDGRWTEAWAVGVGESVRLDRLAPAAVPETYP